VLRDGEFLVAPQALWAAADHRIPLLLVIANNQSYHNDVEHQERMARTGRPIENRWIGQRMVEPAMNFAGLASNLGVEGFGPITDPFGTDVRGCAGSYS
jgi:thiamine pyrophosphate-dependent acetolactate synthase large subunit-like protein